MEPQKSIATAFPEHLSESLIDAWLRDVREKKADLETTLAELAELESKLVGMRGSAPRLQTQDKQAIVVDREPSNDLAGLAIKDCCLRVLRRNKDEFVHYSEVLDLCLERGYQPNQDNPSRDHLLRTFYSSMRQRRDVFEFKTGGYFRVVEEFRTFDSLPKRTTRKKKLRSEKWVEEITGLLRKHGPLGRIEIANKLGANANTVSNYLTEHHFDRVDEKRWTLKEGASD